MSRLDIWGIYARFVLGGPEGQYAVVIGSYGPGSTNQSRKLSSLEADQWELRSVRGLRDEYLLRQGRVSRDSQTAVTDWRGRAHGPAAKVLKGQMQCGLARLAGSRVLALLSPERITSSSFYMEVEDEMVKCKKCKPKAGKMAQQ